MRQGYGAEGTRKSPITDKLKWGLWNLIEQYGMGERAFEYMWNNWYGHPVNELHSKYDWKQGHSDTAKAEIKQEYDNLEPDKWYRVYDLIEYVYHAIAPPVPDSRQGMIHNLFAKDVNMLMSAENSPWRIILGQVVLHMGLEDPKQIEIVASIHKDNAMFVKRAIDHMGPGSDNDISIGESIKILENTLRHLNIGGKTVNIMLTNAEKQLGINSKLICSAQLVNDFANTYARHANPDSRYRVNASDARLVLSLCTAMANYVASVSLERTASVHNQNTI